jgi:hypothetical protein
MNLVPDCLRSTTLDTESAGYDQVTTLAERTGSML